MDGEWMIASKPFWNGQVEIELTVTAIVVINLIFLPPSIGLVLVLEKGGKKIRWGIDT